MQEDDYEGSMLRGLFYATPIGVFAWAIIVAIWRHYA